MNPSLLLLLPLFITLATTAVSGKSTNTNSSNFTTIAYTAYLTHNAPYVWKKNQTVDGIIPQLIRILQRECTQFRINIKIVDWSLEELNQITVSRDPIKLLQSKPGFLKDDPATVSGNIILGTSNFNNLDSHGKKFISLPVVHSKGLAGVVHRDTIGIGLKLYNAMNDSMLILYNGLLLTVIAGVIIWWVVSEMFSFPIILSQKSGARNKL